jgi:fatty acid synthase
MQVVEDGSPFFYDSVDKASEGDKMLCDRVELTGEDVYKEFLLRGYEYGRCNQYESNHALAGPEFRGIHRARNSGVHGTLKWTGNWVSFLDSLLQTALLAERGDTFRLPTRLRYMRIDPLRHLAAVRDDNGVPVIELYNDLGTHGMIAGGVETCDLSAQTVQRRMQAAGKVGT